MTYAAQTRAFVLCSSRSVTSRQSLQGSTAFPVLAILSITSSCVTVPLTITFCVSRFTSKDSTPEERRGTRARVGTKMRSSVGRSDGTSRKSADDRARGEGRAGGVARRGVAAPPAAPTRRRSSRGGVDVERFGSRGNQRERRDRTFHLRQDALHRAGASGAHHRHLQNDRVAHGRVGSVRQGQGVPGAGRDVRRKCARTNSTRPESACQSKSQTERARTCLGACRSRDPLPAKNFERFPSSG